MIKKTNILVTGASGYVGKNLVNLLSENKNFNIFALQNKKNYKDQKNIKFFKIDLTKKKIGKIIKDKIDVIFHLASIQGTMNFYKKTSNLLINNTLMMNNALDFAKKNKSFFIFTSTSELYSNVLKKLKNYENDTIKINNILNLRNSYKISKIYSENLIYSYHKEFGIDFLIFRLNNVYGKNLPSGLVISDLIKKIKNKRKKYLEIMGCNSTRNFIYIDDINEIFIKILNKKIKNKIINLASKENVSIKKLSHCIMEILKIKKRINCLLPPKDSPKHKIPDLTILEKSNLLPKTSLEEGLKKILS
mgnify:CR=1 FL=1|tara:strand:+ start:4415 stop:5329 length:915 start_codon:yes stop_codon:yes gene_type:complete